VLVCESPLYAQGDLQAGAGADDHIDKLAKRFLYADKYPFRRPGERRLIVRASTSIGSAASVRRCNPGRSDSAFPGLERP
jgi:hypothetical protein